MQHKRTYVGPRGWALLTLVSGAAMASPFFRPPVVDLDSSVTPPPSSHTTGLARLASMEFPSADVNGVVRATSDRNTYGLPDLSQQILAPASASPSELPAWAPVSSPIDQLISQGTAPPWQSDSAGASTIKPLAPWINEAGLGQPRPAAIAQPTATAYRTWPDASSLPAAERRPVRSDPATSTASGHIAPTGINSSGNSSGTLPATLTGSLTGTSQGMRTATTPRLRPPEPATAAPARRLFVYQPGFNTTSP